MDHTSVTGSVPTASNASSRERHALSSPRIVGRNWIKIEEAGFRGIAFFVRFYPDTNEFAFITKHLNKAGMWNLHELLIVPLSQVRCLFPEPILANNKYSNSLLDAEINNATACRMQIVRNTAIALRRQLIELARIEGV